MAVKALMTDETGKQIVDAIREKAGLEARVSDLEKNKVDKSSIAQTTGSAEDKVMSQNAVTEELEKKFDKSNVVQSTGDAEDKVMSQAAATKEFGKLSEEIDDIKMGKVKLFSYDKENTNGKTVSELVKAIYLNYSAEQTQYVQNIKDMSILRIGTYFSGQVCVVRFKYNNSEKTVELKNTSLVEGEICGSISDIPDLAYVSIHVVLKDGVNLADIDSDLYLFTPYLTYNMVNPAYLLKIIESNETEERFKKVEEQFEKVEEQFEKVTDRLYPNGNYDQLPSDTTSVLYGDKISVDGELYMFTGEVFEKYYCTNQQYDKEVDFDVAIIGGGTGGVASAYPFINKAFSVALIEKEEKLGGVACNGKVFDWIEGLNTPMLENIYNDMSRDGLVTGVFENSWLPTKFGGTSGGNLGFSPSEMSEKYKTDLTQDNITLYTNATFENVYEKIGNSIKSIVIHHNGVSIKVNAKVFIDASTDLSLVRSVGKRGVDFVFGRDYQSKYNESLAIVSGDTNYLNEPSYYFELVNELDDSELLNSVTTVYRENDIIVAPSYIKATGYVFNSPKNERYCNPMDGAGMQGLEKLKKGTVQYTKELRKRTLEFWKYIKLNLILADERGETEWKDWTTSKKNLGFAEFAEIISDRETYRAVCDEMLTQNDLSVLVENSNHNIAVGSHNIDFHITNGFDVSAIEQFNANELRPYGIKYESLIPINLKNCFVASKCFGASQIACASARVNKVVNQLGWCAGNASLIYLEDGLADVRDVDVSKLNSSQYTDFDNRLNLLLAKLIQ